MKLHWFLQGQNPFSNYHTHASPLNPSLLLSQTLGRYGIKPSHSMGQEAITKLSRMGYVTVDDCSSAVPTDPDVLVNAPGSSA